MRCTCQIISETVESPMGPVNFASRDLCEVCRRKASDVVVLKEAREEREATEALLGRLSLMEGKDDRHNILQGSLARLVAAYSGLAVDGDWLEPVAVAQLQGAYLHTRALRECLFPKGGPVYGADPGESQDG